MTGKKDGGSIETTHRASFVKKEISLEEEGRLRYKVLTNFVNAYKDKMFLSSSTTDGKNKEMKEEMTLADMKEMAK